jgi:hypothetical protein
MNVSSNAAAVTPKGTSAVANLVSAPSRPLPLWARLFMPSIADIVFVALLCAIFGFLGTQLLGDADIGWHIRNGQHILSTRSVPTTDYFSYTMSGRPWYAWEWLYDVLVAGIHSAAGLSGVVLLSALIGALTFALLFRNAMRSSGNLLVAGGLTALAAVAASIHLLARPHMVTWLFTLIWFQQLDRFQRGERKSLFLLPALMLLWVNLHGGFLMGIAVTALFLAGNAMTWIITSSSELRSRAQVRMRHLGLTLLLTLGATFITPYGYRLYAHLYEYLGSKFMMNNIQEFLSPDFHLFQVKAFALLLIVALLALVLQSRKASVIDFLVIAFSAWIGLYAVRNIPIAAMLLTLTVAPMLGESFRSVGHEIGIAPWLRNLATKIDGFSARMQVMDQRFKRHVLSVIVALLLVVGAGARGASALSAQTLHFDEKHMPVQAAEFMAAHNIRDHFFAPDSWSGYLIYRLYPDVRVMMDDRHDFYGEKFVRDYLKVAQAAYGWREVLDAHQVNWVLVPPDSPLASTLKEARDWKVVHDDGTAILFERTAPPTVPGTVQRPR